PRWTCRGMRCRRAEMAGGSSSATKSSELDDEVVEQASFTDINVTPLVDIFLVLLVILMATSTAILEAGQGQGAGFRVSLPTGSKSDEVAAGGDELVIAIEKEGGIVVRGESLSLDELTQKLEE